MKITFHFWDPTSPIYTIGGETESMFVEKLYVLLEALTNLNLVWLSQNYPPPLYESGVVYKKERMRRENWQDIPTTLRKGHGDCEDLTAWRVAVLRYNGEAASPFIEEYPTHNGVYYHVVVRRADGSIEDPSRALGMKG